MEKIFEIKLPADVSPDDVAKDLSNLIGEHAKVRLRPAGRSGQGGKLGQIDPTLFEIVVQLLDTQAVAAVVDSVVTGVMGYVLGKTGRKPAGEPRQKSEED
jgi:hypothetical protein